MSAAVAAAAKTIFVTGATAGFGEAIARLFANHGWKLILVARRQERLDKLKEELGKKVKVHTAVMDVRNKDQVEKVINELPADFSKIDVLINNAGLALGLEPAQRANLEDWDTMIDTNIKGMLYVTRKILPQMVERDDGVIINIGSVAGAYPYPGGNAYGATKAFVRQFSLNLRADLLGKFVRVTDIAPGAAETEFSLVRFKGDEDKAKVPYKGIDPLTAENIADAVFYVVNLPRHVNINFMEIMPTQQSFSPFAFSRRTE